MLRYVRNSSCLCFSLQSLMMMVIGRGLGPSRRISPCSPGGPLGRCRSLKLTSTNFSPRGAWKKDFGWLPSSVKGWSKICGVRSCERDLAGSRFPKRRFIPSVACWQAVLSVPLSVYKCLGPSPTKQKDAKKKNRKIPSSFFTPIYGKWITILIAISGFTPLLRSPWFD